MRTSSDAIDEVANSGYIKFPECLRTDSVSIGGDGAHLCFSPFQLSLTRSNVHLPLQHLAFIVAFAFTIVTLALMIVAFARTR